MLLLSYSLPSMKGHGEQERCLRSGGEPVSFLSSKRTRREGGWTWETTDQSWKGDRASFILEAISKHVEEK